ncbi:hypothetical protein I4U23_012346 [Adineta vaga]|nr:hypothetical protein I4U23_012346 [Adineta vaga]
MISCPKFHISLKMKLILTICAYHIILSFYLFVYRSPDCSHLCPYKSIINENQLIFDSSHTVPYHSEFICPQNFRNLADWIYGWPTYEFDERIEMTTTRGYHIKSCLVAGSIIYVKTDYLDAFFSKVYPYLQNKFVLITGQSDASSPSRYLSYLDKHDSKIIHWFGQNSEIHLSDNNKFTPIPIGINCYEMANALRNAQRQRQQTFTHNRTSHSLDDRPKSKLLLINFQRLTDPTGIRSHVWKALCNNNTTTKFILCIDKSDGVNISGLPTIYARNRQYPFWLSPRGNGLDCHELGKHFISM